VAHQHGKAPVVGEVQERPVGAGEPADVGQGLADGLRHLVRGPVDERRGRAREQVLEVEALAQGVEGRAPRLAGPQADRSGSGGGGAAGSAADIRRRHVHPGLAPGARRVAHAHRRGIDVVARHLDAGARAATAGQAVPHQLGVVGVDEDVEGGLGEGGAVEAEEVAGGGAGVGDAAVGQDEQDGVGDRSEEVVELGPGGAGHGGTGRRRCRGRGGGHGDHVVRVVQRVSFRRCGARRGGSNVAALLRQPRASGNGNARPCGSSP
jgi:hypothetical protein